MSLLRFLTRKAIIFLGFFEFYIVAELLLASPEALQSTLLVKHSLLPSHFLLDELTRYLLCIFTVFLGLLRVSFSLSGGGWGPWLCLVATHASETVFMWTIALKGDHFNPQHYDLSTLIAKVVSGEVGTKESRPILLVVPVLLLISLLHGPSRFKKDKKKVKDQ